MIICVCVLAFLLLLVAGIWAFRQKRQGKEVKFTKIRYWKQADLKSGRDILGDDGFGHRDSALSAGDHDRGIN